MVFQDLKNFFMTREKFNEASSKRVLYLIFYVGHAFSQFTRLLRLFDMLFLTYL